MTNLRALPLFLALLLTCLVACEKTIIKDDSLTGDLEGLSFEVVDTFTIYASTVEGFPFPPPQNDFAIGRLDDPVFGINTAAVSTHLRLPTNNIDLGNNLTLDSVVLMLRPLLPEYAYGDTSAPVTFTVHEVTEFIEPGKEYKSNVKFDFSSTEIGRLENVVPGLNQIDSIEVGGINKPAHLRIPLDFAFWQNVFNQSGTPNMANNEAFRSFLNGIHIKVDENQSASAMYYYNLGSPFSKVAFYYRDADGVHQTFDLLIAGESVRVNHFEHDFSGTFVEQIISETVTAPGDSVLYIKSMGGTVGLLEMPHIEQLRGKVINKAELIVTLKSDPLDEANEALFPPPSRMIINALNEDGTQQFLVDQFVSTEYFGGFKTEEEVNGTTYNRFRFNLGRHLQDLLLLDEIQPFQKQLYLLNFPPDRFAHRSVVGGSNSTETGLKLRITYTNID